MASGRFKRGFATPSARIIRRAISITATSCWALACPMPRQRRKSAVCQEASVASDPASAISREPRPRALSARIP